jgi:hypothetical protein
MPDLTFRVRDSSGLSASRTLACSVQAPPSPPTGFPNASNTGVTNEAALTAHPAVVYNIQTPGAVIQNKIFSRAVQVMANNVTIRNCRFKFASDFYMLRVYDGYTNSVLEDCEFDGMGSVSINAALAGPNWTARRCDIQGVQDGAKIGLNNTVEDCWIHNLWTTKADPHYDCVQSTGGSGCIIRRNFLDVGVGAGRNACVILKSDLGPLDNTLIEGNLMNGGGFTVMVRMGNGGFPTPTNTRLLNNRFGASTYGPVSLEPGLTIERSGNVWNDSGAPIPGG